jgi:hypothetical protein
VSSTGATTRSKQDAIPAPGTLLSGLSPDGTPVPLPALGAFQLPRTDVSAAINNDYQGEGDTFATPFAEGPSGAILAGLGLVGLGVYLYGER